MVDVDKEMFKSDELKKNVQNNSSRRSVWKGAHKLFVRATIDFKPNHPQWSLNFSARYFGNIAAQLYFI